MDYSEIVKELIEYGKLAGIKNMTPGITGNLSARYGDNVIITKTSTANGDLSEDDFVIIDYAGNVVSGNGKPSSEKFLHLEFYKMRSDINCIFHVHPVYLCSLASCGYDLTEPVMPENIFYFGEIPLADYALPGSFDLVDKTAKFFDKHDVVMMANHGVIVGADNVRNAYMKLELAESYAQIIFNCKLLGNTKLLTNCQVAEIISLKN
ncbi:class II aldolase/adducin family protein [bacterium]|nr:class II aldolase/adducin family protein [bacterium]